MSRQLLRTTTRRIWLAFVLAALWVLWGVYIFYCAWMDQSLRLSNGIGLLDHYGFMALFLAGPVICFATYMACNRFLRMAAALVARQPSSAKRTAALAITAPHSASISLKRGSRWSFLLLLLCLIGLLTSVNNLAQLVDPARYWGNDVFNAMAYRRSYVAANSYLLILWSAIYPVAIFYTFHIAISTRMIVNGLASKKMLELDPLHPDGRGGTRGLIPFNMASAIYLVLAATLLALFFTHKRTYVSSIAGAILFALLFTAQSLFGSLWLARVIRHERDRAVVRWNHRIRELMRRRGLGSTEVLIAMRYRDYLMAPPIFRYVSVETILVNLITLTPTMLELVSTKQTV